MRFSGKQSLKYKFKHDILKVVMNNTEIVIRKYNFDLILIRNDIYLRSCHYTILENRKLKVVGNKNQIVLIYC